MKQLKKAVTSLALVAMVLAGVLFVSGMSRGGKVQAESTLTKETQINQKNAYEDFMGQNKKIKVPFIDGYDFENAQTGKFQTKLKNINVKKFIYSNYVDINNDGIEELLVSNKNPKDGYGKILICSCEKNTVKPMLCVTGIRNGIFTAKNHQLCLRFGASDEDTYVFIKMSQYTIKHVVTYRDESCNMAGGKQHHTYYKNAEKIQKSVFKNGKKNLMDAIICETSDR